MTIIIDRTRDRSKATGPVSVAERQREKDKPKGLYKARVPIYPKLVHGRWRWIKWALLIVMLALVIVPAAAQDETPRQGIRPDAPPYAIRGPYAVGQYRH